MTEFNFGKWLCVFGNNSLLFLCNLDPACTNSPKHLFLAHKSKCTNGQRSHQDPTVGPPFCSSVSTVDAASCTPSSHPTQSGPMPACETWAHSQVEMHLQLTAPPLTLVLWRPNPSRRGSSMKSTALSSELRPWTALLSLCCPGLFLWAALWPLSPLGYLVESRMAILGTLRLLPRDSSLRWQTRCVGDPVSGHHISK
jgi:hypothetical protein